MRWNDPSRNRTRNPFDEPAEFIILMFGDGA